MKSARKTLPPTGVGEQKQLILEHPAEGLEQISVTYVDEPHDKQRLLVDQIVRNFPALRSAAVSAIQAQDNTDGQQLGQPHIQVFWGDPDLSLIHI